MINLREKYGKRYKVTLNGAWEGGRKEPFYEIVGKRGYIRPFGKNLELYLTSIVLANRIERDYKQFEVKNHYDDATAFEFTEEYLPAACKFIKAKNRRQMTPEGLERLARLRSLIAKPLVASTSARE